MKKGMLCIFVILFTVLIYELIQKYSVVNVKISEQEQEEINSFYEINPDSISRGKIFDLKYVYCDPKNEKTTRYVEVVLKNKMPYEIGTITYYDKNGKRLDLNWDIHVSGDTIQKLDPLMRVFDSSNENKRLGWFYGVTMIVNTASSFNHTSADYDFSEMTIEMEIKKGLWNLQKETETHHIVFNEDAQLSSIRKIKNKIMNGESGNAYEKRQIDYYFIILFRKDFDQWYDEVKEFLLKTQDVDVHFPDAVLNLSSFSTLESDEEIKRVFNFDDKQVIKYKEIVQLIIDLNIYPEYAKYLENNE